MGIVLHLQNYRRLHAKPPKKPVRQTPPKRALTTDEKTALALLGAFGLGLLVASM